MKNSPATTPALDRIDRKLLRLLQEDASQANIDLAEKTHLSPPACSRRVARLKQLGFIRRTVALVNPRALGYNGLVIIGVVLDRSTPDSFAAFEKAAAGVTGCLEVQLVTGEFDYFVKLRIQGIDAFNELHAAQLIGLPGVRQVRTFVCLKEVFETTRIPV
jgi:DNA-binding Lrp family transcriptional regulator